MSKKEDNNNNCNIIRVYNKYYSIIDIIDYKFETL